MARGGLSISDLAYYGAIGGGGWIAYKLALQGELGCSAYQAAAQVYGAIKSNQTAPAPHSDSKAAQDPNCKQAISAAPAGGGGSSTGGGGTTAGPSQPAAPSGSVAPSAPPSSGQTRSTSLHDFGNMPLVFDYAIDALRQDPAVGGTNTYGQGDAFLDRSGNQWKWVGRADLLLAVDGTTTQSVDSFFT